ncbi:RecX family transcriptional regulator [bacterium]|nr:MAG: RecX family transcriptional regulator [bacterium]
MLVKKIQLTPPESPVTLPGKITSITVQSVKKDRCSIFVEGEFLIGIEQNLLLQFGFKKGEIVQPEHYEELWEIEQQNKVFHWLLSRLETRAHGKEELRQKAKLKGFPNHWIEPAIQKVEKLSLLNDEQFARSFCNDKFRFKKWGPVKIKVELKKKGIADSVIQKVVAELHREQDFKQEINALLAKRERHFNRESDIQKRKQKMMSYLAGKGYPMQEIMNVLRNLNSSK